MITYKDKYVYPYNLLQDVADLVQKSTGKAYELKYAAEHFDENIAAVFEIAKEGKWDIALKALLAFYQQATHEDIVMVYSIPLREVESTLIGTLSKLSVGEVFNYLFIGKELVEEVKNLHEEYQHILNEYRIAIFELRDKIEHLTDEDAEKYIINMDIAELSLPSNIYEKLVNNGISTVGEAFASKPFKYLTVKENKLLKEILESQL